jgi:hypothetical protein
MTIMENGFKTLIDFGQGAGIFHERTVTPPAMSMGGAIDLTGHRNVGYRTKAPKKLKDMGEITSVGGYDPSAYSSFLALLGVNQEITLTFPDESTVVFWGWLDSFAPGGLTEGTYPDATITIIVSNVDADGDEIAPVYTAPV